MSSGDRRFRVVVIGGGVAGLTASHCLQKAGIDHIVLERRRDISPPEGASIAIYPHGARILYQLGILNAVRDVCSPCNRWYCRRPDGTTLSNNGFFGYVKENHGEDILLLERRKFLRILYDTLPNKSFLYTNRCVKNVEQSANEVKVTLEDGTVEVGDIVIGCDGVHSLTRTAMWAHANSNIKPGAYGHIFSTKEKLTIKTRWKCLIGMAPQSPELGTSDMTVVHDSGFSFLALTQPTATFFFVFIRLNEPFTWPHREHYTEADANEVASKYASHPVSRTLLFGELWRRRLRGQLVAIEEGILNRWYDNRIVLAGDSAHKVTPNIALGGNTAIESVVVLTNHLQSMMVDQGQARPSRAMLNNCFEKYQTECRERAIRIMKFSSLITSVQAWETYTHRFIATWVLPLQPDRAVADQLGGIIREAPRLEFLSTEGFPSGKMSWKSDEKQIQANGSFSRGKAGYALHSGLTQWPFQFGAACGAIMIILMLISCL